MDILQDKFQINETSPIQTINGNFIKITINKVDLKKCLSFLKNSGEFSADMLHTIIANDLNNKIELIYDVFSSQLNTHKFISILIDSNNPVVESVSDIFKSAEYDEREIFDLFGVAFEGNKNLKRLLMPYSTVGNPLLKNFRQTDERLAWNE